MKVFWVILPALVLAGCGRSTPTSNTAISSATPVAPGPPAGPLAAAMNPVLGHWIGNDDGCTVDLHDVEFTPTQALFHSPDSSQPSAPASYSDVSAAGASVTVGEAPLRLTAVMHVVDPNHLLVDPIVGSTDTPCHLTRR